MEFSGLHVSCRYLVWFQWLCCNDFVGLSQIFLVFYIVSISKLFLLSALIVLFGYLFPFLPEATLALHFCLSFWHCNGLPLPGCSFSSCLIFCLLSCCCFYATFCSSMVGSVSELPSFGPSPVFQRIGYNLPLCLLALSLIACPFCSKPNLYCELFCRKACVGIFYFSL